MRSRGLASPDRADAVLATMSKPPATGAFQSASDLRGGAASDRLMFPMELILAGDSNFFG
jgi:hypothetical protein